MSLRDSAFKEVFAAARAHFRAGDLQDREIRVAVGVHEAGAGGEAGAVDLQRGAALHGAHGGGSKTLFGPG